MIRQMAAHIGLYTLVTLAGIAVPACVKAQGGADERR